MYFEHLNILLGQNQTFLCTLLAFYVISHQINSKIANITQLLLTNQAEH